MTTNVLCKTCSRPIVWRGDKENGWWEHVGSPFAKYPTPPTDARPIESDHSAEDECLTCGELDDVEGECPGSQRPCGHHCNCSWIHDHCHWCDAEFGEQ